MTKKGQAATEFLMSYGWSVLAVLLAISALGYFGIHKFSTQKPNICLTEQPFSCIDASYSGELSFVLVNNGVDVENLNVTLTPPGGSRTQCQFIPSFRSAYQKIITCPVNLTQGYHKSDIHLTYNSRSSLTKDKRGSVSVNVH